MERFKTLMLREWMQHRLGWIIVVGAPALVLLALAVFGLAQVHVGEGDEIPPPLAMAVVTTGATAAITLAIAWMAVLFQSSGLARRDTQDRSIEFWLSLPVGHAQSIGAPLLAHLILVPVAALVVGMLGGIVVSLPAVAHMYGLREWAALPWGAILGALAALTLRLALGIVLATLWLSPLILGVMVASAWLKRWGWPVLAAVVGVGGLVLDKVYGNPIVWQVLGTLGRFARQGFIAAQPDADPERWNIRSPHDADVVLSILPKNLLLDGVDALGQLVSPTFVAVAVVAVAAFMLLVLRRQRGA
jgi:ABC-2 type transport system permease protein